MEGSDLNIDNQTETRRILGALDKGDYTSADELIRVLYDELRALARRMMRKLPPGNTLQPTALVNEAYLRLVGESDPGWSGRGHFFGAAARAMRQILVDQARRKGARKHGGDLRRVHFEELDAEMAITSSVDDAISLDKALRELEASDPRAARVVDLRFFAGLTMPEIAQCLDISTSTAEREWKFARAFIRHQLVGTQRS